MRLIRKRNVADSIAAYDLKWVRAEFRREAYFVTQEKGKDFMTKIIQPQNLLSDFRKNSTMSGAGVINDSISININKAFMNEFLVFLYYVKISTRQDKRDYQDIEQSAESLITLIKKEYHLK